MAEWVIDDSKQFNVDSSGDGQGGTGSSGVGILALLFAVGGLIFGLGGHN